MGLRCASLMITIWSYQRISKDALGLRFTLVNLRIEGFRMHVTQCLLLLL